MRIPTSSNVSAEALAATRSSETVQTESMNEAATALASADATPVLALQSAVLKPAMKAMQSMPEIDAEKVAQLRDAISSGSMPSFDPSKLAGLIQRFHGGES